MAVIGGGLTGLSAANRLLELAAESAQPLESTLYEAGAGWGGVVGTRALHGYLVELGADSFITNRPAAVNLCRRLGLEQRLIPTDPTFRRAFVLHKGRPTPVPDGFQLLTTSRVLPLLRSPLFTPWGKLRMALEYVLPRGGHGGDESLAHFVRRRFGREALERLVQPLVGGIYTSDPEKLSLQATLPRFLDMEREHGSLIRAARRQLASQAGNNHTGGSGARYGLFATLQGGVGELIDALAARVLRNTVVHRETPVVSITPDPRGGYLVTPRNAPPARFDAVILATSAYRAADLLQEAAPALATPLRRIEYASTVIVVSGHKLADVRHPLDAFGLVIPAIERRRILAVSFASRKFPGRAPDGCVQLRTFVGGAMQPELFDLPDAAIEQLVAEELSSLLGVSGRPDFTLAARWSRAMPQYHLGHVDLVAEIEREAARLPGLALAGNAYHGVGIPDCIHSGEAAAEKMFRSEP